MMKVGKTIAIGLFLTATVTIGLAAIAANQHAEGGDRLTGGETATATFAAGCFWYMEGPFDKLTGVISTTSGYIGGHVVDPTYEQVSSGTTGHTEAVEIRYDPGQVSYAELLRVFWKNVDPTTADRQFCDRGSQYRPAVFHHGESQREAAIASFQEIEQTKSFKEPLRVELAAASKFYPAEDYHQDYYLKNPVRYKFYRYNCGRDQRLRQLWGDAS